MQNICTMQISVLYLSSTHCKFLFSIEHSLQFFCSLSSTHCNAIAVAMPAKSIVDHSRSASFCCSLSNYRRTAALPQPRSLTTLRISFSLGFLSSHMYLVHCYRTRALRVDDFRLSPRNYCNLACTCSLSVFSYIAAVLLALAAIKVCFAACHALLHPTHTSSDDYLHVLHSRFALLH